MNHDRRAGSILEFLTHPNPDVVHLEPNSMTNTHDWQYHFPKQLKKWDNFKFEVLKEIEGGKLFNAARREAATLPHYPTLSTRVDLKVQDEPSTRKLVEKWSESMVTSALECVENEFNHAVWMLGHTTKSNEYRVPAEEGIERVVPYRRSSAHSRKRSKRRAKKRFPDSGAVSANSKLPHTGADHDHECKERFPKEYKVAKKWLSTEFFMKDLLDAHGKWKRGAKRTNYAMPIGQAYSYCLDTLCRYGCILTCSEAFIFRVTPRNPASNKTLADGLINDGLMEWISIPWSNHCEGDLDKHASWTINLALWFMHILVGKHYEVDWEYKDLQLEELEIAPGPTDNLATRQNEQVDRVEKDASADDGDTSSNDTDDTSKTVVSPVGRKRKRPANEGEEQEREAEYGDMYSLSFSQERSFTNSLTQMV